MKTPTLLAAFLSAVSAFATTTVSDVIVRQQWPWKTDVSVEFFVNGSTGGVSQVTMAAYRGDTFLGYIPQTACSGDMVFTSDGQKRLSFDPTAVDFLVSAGNMGNFRVDVAIADTPDDEILYKIFDLRKTAGTPGAVQYVTESALTNGMWGAWERDYWGEDMARTVIWTGVTNNPAYKTTHLVMRRIPAGPFTYGTPTSSSLYTENDTVATTVTITEPYYMAVFETTYAQYAHILDPATNATVMSPVNYKYYGTTTAKNAVRSTGKASDTQYDWPTGRSVWRSSIAGKLRSCTQVNFDLPTEAQWEKAARAGSTGIYYDSNSNEPNTTRLSQLAWYYTNSKNGGDSRGSQIVGQKKPNAYGLYDVIGNVTEMCLDWYEAGHEPAASNPEGPTTGANRVNKGFHYESYAADHDANIHLGNRGSNGTSTGNNRWGFRFCCPAN